jgi:hypothetical protein
MPSHLQGGALRVGQAAGYDFLECHIGSCSLF